MSSGQRQNQVGLPGSGPLRSDGCPGSQEGRLNSVRHGQRNSRKLGLKGDYKGLRPLRSDDSCGCQAGRGGGVKQVVVAKDAQMTVGKRL
jgi:hypothetical protein